MRKVISRPPPARSPAGVRLRAAGGGRAGLQPERCVLGWVPEWETWRAGNVRSGGAAPQPSSSCYPSSVMHLFSAHRPLSLYVAIPPHVVSCLNRYRSPYVAIITLDKISFALSPHYQHLLKSPHPLSRSRRLVSPAPLFYCYHSSQKSSSYLRVTFACLLLPSP